jgi:exopolyphosphatase / guanosine-5'-triphosphate,3'-diphosphate pyrophosphatase
MISVRRAVIDVGTNSIKLLVAEVEGDQVRPLLEQSKQTRLGQGFYPNHILQPGPIGHTAEAIAVFLGKANDLGAARVQVIATSAARDARNPERLSQAIERASGLPMRIISGLEEADYVFRGITTDPNLAETPLLVLDVGGGSTEFIVGQGKAKRFAQSFPLGSVRLLEQLHLSDPPGGGQLSECRANLQTFFDKEIAPAVGPFLRAQNASRGGAEPEIQLVGTGGTASILGGMEAMLPAFDRERLEQTRLSRDRVRWHVEHLWNSPASQRRQIVGLPPNRADIILTGTTIYECVMNCFGFRELRVSTRGLRFAVVMESD